MAKVDNCNTCSSIGKPQVKKKPCANRQIASSASAGGGISGPLTIDSSCEKPVFVEICKNTGDYELACASTDGRIIIVGVDALGVGVLTEIDGSPIADGATAVKCDKEFIEKDFCFQDITDNSIQYVKLVILDAETNAVLSEVWFDANGDIIAEPSDIELCESDLSRVIDTCGIISCDPIESISGTNNGLDIFGSGTANHTIKHSTISQAITDQLKGWIDLGYTIVIEFDTGEVAVVDTVSFYSATNTTFLFRADHTQLDPCNLFPQAVDGSSNNGAVVTYTAYLNADSEPLEVIRSKICQEGPLEVTFTEPDPVEECSIDYFLGCDDINGDGSLIMTFLKPIETCYLAGVQTSQTALPFLDENLDAYTPNNEVVCDPATLPFESETFCDNGTGTSFIRRTIIIAGTGAIVEEVELDGTTAYTPIGNVTAGSCELPALEADIVDCESEKSEGFLITTFLPLSYPIDANTLALSLDGIGFGTNGGIITNDLEFVNYLNTNLQGYVFALDANNDITISDGAPHTDLILFYNDGTPSVTYNWPAETIVNNALLTTSCNDDRRDDLLAEIRDAVLANTPIDYTTILNSILLSVQNIDSNTDTVEASLATIITLLGTLDSDNDAAGLAAILAAINASILELQAIDANTDNLEAQLLTINNSIILEGNETQAALATLNATNTGILNKLNQPCTGAPQNVNICNRAVQIVGKCYDNAGTITKVEVGLFTDDGTEAWIRDHLTGATIPVGSLVYVECC